MFGYCMWILLNRINHYNKIINEFNTNLNLNRHSAHITEKYNIDNNLLTSLKNYKISNVKEFKPINKVYQCSKNNFHALQLDLLPKNENNYHISLSYRTDRPYTENEINKINKYKFLPIKLSECSLKIVNCDSTNSNEWYEYKKNE